MIRAAPLKAFPRGNQNHTKRQTARLNVTRQQKYTVHTLAISSMLVLSEQNLTFGLHCVCSSNDHGRRVGLALQKAGDWNSRLFNICGFPLN